MPHADFMPSVVFPDTKFGSHAWSEWEKSEHTRPYFCSEYVADQFAKVKHQCARRNPDGHKGFNLCHRCTSGFLFDFEHSLSAS